MNRLINLFFSILSILAVSACDRNTTRVTGEVEGGGSSVLTLERLNVNRTTLIDSVEVDRRGTFSLKLKAETPELYVLKNPDGKIINLLLSPGEEVKVNTTAEEFDRNYQVDGSEESDKIRKLVLHMDETRQTLDSLWTASEAIADPFTPQMDLIRSAIGQTIIAQKRFTIRHLVENMDSPSSVYALYQKYDEDTPVLGEETDLQYFIAIADSLEQVYPNSSLTRSLRADIELKKNAFAQDQQLNALLSMADEVTGVLDLSIPDRNGREVALSSLKGSVILVAFWASGNQESVDALLRLRATYGKYHDRGFEVYAVSLDNDKVNWMSAIDYNEFSWINVSELSYPESRSRLIYNVTTLPTSFLINREGDIVARDLYGKTLETWLDNLI